MIITIVAGGRPSFIKIVTIIDDSIKNLSFNNWKQGQVPELWDGRAAKCIIDSLVDLYSL